jgi:hypothetical protein
MSTTTNLQGELCHVRDLVRLRDLLRGRGATAAELQRYDAAIRVARARLARFAKEDSARLTKAA